MNLQMESGSAVHNTTLQLQVLENEFTDQVISYIRVLKIGKRKG